MKRIISAFLIILLIITQTACASNKDSLPYSATTFALDTICEITLYSVDGSALDPEKDAEMNYALIISSAFRYIGELEDTLSKTVEGSDVWKINHAGGEYVKVKSETMDVILKGMKYCELSDGAFDITIGKVTDLWNFRGENASISQEPADSGRTGENGENTSDVGSLSDSSENDNENNNENNDGINGPDSIRYGTVPEADVLKDAVSHVDYTKVIVDEDNMTVCLSDSEMEIDLGGIAKGFIADKVAEFLKNKGVTGAIVNLGGNLVALGSKKGSDYSLGINDPLSESGNIMGIIKGCDTTIVTSGTYDRYFEVDGKKYHHILDSKTGYPVDTKVLQVSIIAPMGMSVDCDGLSTACLALGTEKGTELICGLAKTEEYSGIEAIFLEEDGQVYFTNPNTSFVMNKR